MNCEECGNKIKDNKGKPVRFALYKTTGPLMNPTKDWKSTLCDPCDRIIGADNLRRYEEVHG